MTQPHVFQGQVVLIIGAGRGLGLAYARLIGTLGTTILLHDVGTDDSGNGLDPDVARAAASRLREEEPEELRPAAVASGAR